jgi:hypothetical protein
MIAGSQLQIATQGLYPGPLLPLVVALQGLLQEEPVQPYLFGSAGGTASVPLRPKAKPRPAWRPPMPIIPRVDLEEDEALLICGLV